MARIIVFIIAAAAILVVLSVLFWSFLHLLTVAFWVVVVVLLGFGLFRIGRSSGSRSRRSTR
jgi:hypothetical protein